MTKLPKTENLIPNLVNERYFKELFSPLVTNNKEFKKKILNLDSKVYCKFTKEKLSKRIEKWLRRLII